jgi:hypothetical protein
VTGLEIALGTGLVLVTIAVIRVWSALDDERCAVRGLQSDNNKLRQELGARAERGPVWEPHETDDVIRDLIRQRDRYQKQAIDLQLATNGLLAEREELFRELRRRAN